MKFFLVFINFLNISIAINYSEHISSIIYNKCTSCHRPNQIAGYLPLTNYSEVYNQKEAIAYAISGNSSNLSRHGKPSMPPWPPNRNYSTLLYERYLEEDEVHLVLDWIDTGAYQGDPILESPMPIFSEDSMIGEPDANYIMQESYTIDGNFEDDYRCFIIDLDFNNDKAISAIEFRPGNKEAVHHALVTYVESGSADYLDEQDDEYGYECYGGFGLNTSTDIVGGYTPGSFTAKYPIGIGRTIPANSDLIVQIHYAPSLVPQIDRSSVNIFFNDEIVDRELKQFIFDDWDFVLPPNIETTITNTLVIPNDISLTSFFPHCHLLGESWEIYAITSLGQNIPIIKIDDWDFDWQSFYYPEYMLVIPGGSTLYAKCTYNNKSSNPDNPNNPPVTVYPGLGTNDEMFYIPFDYLDYRQGDENIYLGQVSYTFGDLNNDNDINVGDIVVLVNLILSDQYSNSGDLNQDNTLNVSDVVLMVNLILGRINLD